MPAAVKTIAALFFEQAKGLWIYYPGAVLFAAFLKTFKWGAMTRIPAFSSLVGVYGPRGDL